MDRRPVHVCVLLAFLAVAGCRQNERAEPPVVEQAAEPPTSTTVTLSAEQLMALDWGGTAVERSAILDRRPAGAGVEFDIRFPGDSEGVCSVDYVSSGTAGKGALVGLDVSRYEAFALKFTLISVNANRRDPNIPLEVAAGAIIGPAGNGRLYACEPVVLGLSSQQASSVATTKMRTGRIRVIGIHANMVAPQAWDTNGGIVTLRVEPAPGADVLPAPVAVDANDTAASPSDGRTVKNSGPKSRTESATTSTFGSQRIGAW